MSDKQPVYRLVAGVVVTGAVLALTPLAAAMQALDDSQLANVSGRDGLTVMFQTPGIDLSMALRSDIGTDYEAGIQLENMSFAPVQVDGSMSPPGTLASMVTTFDVGATAGVPFVRTTLDLSRVRLHVEDVDLYGKPKIGAAYGPVQRVGSFGELVMDASGEIELINSNGFFNSADGGSDAYLYGKLTNTNMFYRQQSSATAPYLLFTEGTAEWRVTDGIVGIVSGLSDPFNPGYDDFNRYVDGGVMTKAPFIDVEYIFNYRYKQPQPSNTDMRMTVDNSLGMYSFGWKGTFTDAQLIFGGGGLDKQGGAASEGLRFSSRFNYLRGDNTTSNNPSVVLSGVPATSSAFVWSFGVADVKNEFNNSVGPSGDGELRFDVTDWRNLPAAAYAHTWPYIGIDVVNEDQGSTPLCWGASIAQGCGGFDQQSIGFSPSRTALAVSVREGALRTYSERLRVTDSYYDSGVRDFDWGLIYTFANVDADIYLYPTSPDGSQTRGLWADITVMSQTLDANSEFRTTGGNRADNWRNGSHLMIADTDFGNAIGMMNQSFLLIARDARIQLKPLGAPDGAGNFTKAAAQQGGIDITAPKARFNLFATFGGRDLPQRGQADPYTAYPTFYETCPVGQTCPSTLVGGVNSWNYEGFLNLRLSPPANNSTNAQDTTYLGYSLGFRATSNGVGFGNPACSSADSISGLCSGEGTYFATAEPGQQQAKVGFGAVTGDMSFVDGEIHLIGTSEEGDNTPKLRMKHTLLVGLAATADLNARAAAVGGLPGGAAGQVFQIGSLNFDGQHLGAVVVPKGIYYGEMALKPQVPVGTNGLPFP